MGCYNWAESASFWVSHAAVFLWDVGELEFFYLTGGLLFPIYLKQTTKASTLPTPPPQLAPFLFNGIGELPHSLTGSNIISCFISSHPFPLGILRNKVSLM